MKRAKQPVRPGSAPGTIDGVQDGDPSRCEVIDYSPDKVARHDRPEVAAPEAGINRWIRIAGSPDRKTLENLRDRFGVHELVIEDLVSVGTRIKVEEYDSYTFAVLRTTTLDDAGELQEQEIDLLLFDSVLVTVDHGENDTMFEPIIERLDRPDSFIRRSGVDVLYYAIIDLTVDLLFPVADQLDDDIDHLEDEIFTALHESQLGSVQRLRSTAQRLRSIAGSTRYVVARIERGGHRGLTEDTRFYFRDVHDHIIHLLETFANLKENTANLMEVYRSGVNNRINDVMKVLTIISTVFIPITFIAGIYGMNFVNMPELRFPWAYPATLGLMAVIAGGMILFFKRKKWF